MNKNIKSQPHATLSKELSDPRNQFRAWWVWVLFHPPRMAGSQESTPRMAGLGLFHPPRMAGLGFAPCCVLLIFIYALAQSYSTAQDELGETLAEYHSCN